MLLISLSYAVSAAKKEGASISFVKDTKDIGMIRRSSGLNRVVFEFENTGVQPIVILGVRTSCSCMKAKFSRKPLPVGSHGFVTITIEAAKMDEGVFHRVVQVKTNAGVSLLTLQGQMVEN